MDILDDNLITEGNEGAILRSPKFLRRLRVFSIITLANAIVLFLFPVMFTIIVSLGAHINGSEMLMLIIAGLSFVAGGVVLYMSYTHCRDYLENPENGTHLVAAMRWFLYFWLLLIGSLLIQALLVTSFL